MPIPVDKIDTSVLQCGQHMTKVVERTAIGYRSFRGPEEDGSLSTKNALDLDNKRDTMTGFTMSLPFKRGYIITTSDLPQVGRLIFDGSNLNRQNTDVIFAKCKSKNVSYAGMLNPFMEAASGADYCAIVSPSIIGKNVEKGKRQIQFLADIFDLWEAKYPGKLATAGTLVEGEQDPDMALDTINGNEEITLKNLWRVFPNNTMAIVRSSARYSFNTDNGKLGTFELGGKTEKIGGNEDFYYTFESMLNGQDCAVLINPVMPGERSGKVETVGQKVQRREFVYGTYAKILVLEHLKQNAFRKLTEKVKDRYVLEADGTFNYSQEMFEALDKYNNFVRSIENMPQSIIEATVEEVVKNTVDKHLHFIRVNEDGQLEVVPTKRQTLINLAY